ncbi:MAG TPA: two-component regulator propeller domain-containing protein, partial [Anaerolineae bacterium]|nr:two-component regulator propeller domain-containing protein [Anaerolineae bacterium]
GTFTPYRHDPDDSESLSSDSVSALLVDRQGDLWIGTAGGGLNRLALSKVGGSDPVAGTFVRYRHDPDNPDSLSNDMVLSILEDSAGNVWVGTLDGLDRFDPSADSGQPKNQVSFTHYRHDPEDPQSLSENVILSLHEDRSNVLWVGTVDGANRFNRREDQFIHYRKDRDPPEEPTYGLDVSSRLQDPQPSILSDGRVLAVHEDRAGELWIGTFDGGLNRLDRLSGKLSVYRHDPADPTSLSSNEVGAVYEDRAGILWVGTGNGFLEQFDPHTETFTHYLRLGASRLYAIAEDPAGNLWIGTNGEGLYRLSDDRQALEHYIHYWREPDHWWRDGSLSSHIVLSLAIDRAGVLWVGTAYGGINIWGDVTDRFAHHRHDPDDLNSLSHDQVLAISEDPAKEVVWIGTGGGGLNRFNRATQTFTHYTMEDGLLGDTVGCILIDDAGFLWLGTVKGLSRFDPHTETFRNYDRRDGVGVLSAGSFAPGNCFQGQTGEMFFGGFDGLYVFNPEKIKENLQTPLLAITAFKIFNETMRRDLLPSEHVHVPYQDNFLSFEFAALDYTMPEKNQYAYRMEGLDKDWVYAGTRRFADYPDLKPGEYTFRVKGSNNDGVWNEEGTAIRITVEPPIWDTWFFRGMGALALVLGVVGVYRQRVKSVEARSRELEREVEERTHEIERRRQVAEGLRDILAVINSDRPLDEVLEYIVIQAGRLLGAGAAVLHEIEPERRLVTIEATAGLPEELSGLGYIPYDASWADEAILTRQPYMVSDLKQAGTGSAAESDSLGGRWLEITRECYRSFMAVPLIVEAKVNHCLAFYYVEPRAVSDEEIKLAVALADQAALAIENAWLYERARDLAAMEERQRLARDLHDAVSQTLFSASLIAETLPDLWQSNPEEGWDLLEKLRQLNRGALAEMRGLLMELRPAALAEASMKELLRQLGQAVSGREGIPVTVSVDEPCELPTDVRIALYRITQEALNNVAKHAQASQVDVRLQCTPHRSPAHSEGTTVTLCIRDDGLGFDPCGVSQDRLGLGIMHERAAAVGATVKIESQVGQGTVVTVQWRSDE